ncbi:type IV conjugative transfer system protein TraE [Mucispirillum schaedleri]|uniref:type IV conjugative transfer system protein TraE n=1 Tax=Mucispirillum schaedleri TaxID=248039 RepID=UPI001F575637|nr:type IV conjugative transfer system protein TraE [Mucispirillum schaedleri]
MKDKINNIKNIDVNDIKNKLSVKLDNFSTFKNINKLNNEKKFFGFIIIILVFVILVQGLLNYNLITANRTIVLPPAITKEFWATDKHISESYFEQVGFYIADRVLSVSPETVDSSYVSLLPFFDSSSKNLKAVRDKLKEQADFIKSENMYQIFYPLHMYPDYSNNQIKIEGPMKKFIGEMLVQEASKSYITIHYEIKAGRFMIKSLDFKYKD